MKTRLMLAGAVLTAGLLTGLAMSANAARVSLPATTTTTATIETTTTTEMPTTTTTEAPPVSAAVKVPARGISLPEAKAEGLWGREGVFRGCVSKYGVHSPDWLNGALLTEAGWPQESWDKLCRVIGCESGFRPDALGGIKDRYGWRMTGLLQIDRKSWKHSDGIWRFGDLAMTDAEIMSPLGNLRFGLALYQATRDDDDWNHWPGDQWTCNRA